MRLRLAALLLLLVPGLPCPAAAQGPIADATDSLVERYRVAHGVPGLSVAVVRRGQVVKARGYGEANLELHVPASVETIYQSGSVGKQFAAALALLLVEDGKLQLDAPIRRYLPEGPPSWSRITVRQLLTHTSGLGEYTESKQVNLRKDYTEQEIVALAAKQPPLFPPGAHWSYCNTGYALLGVIMGRVTGRFYGDVLHDRIFAPLGMATARIISESAIVPNRAAGYERDSTGLRNQTWVAPALNTTADGSLYLTVEDLIAWDAALRERKLLSPASYDLWWTPGRLNDGTPTTYGFGWFVDDARGRPWVRHAGSWQGFKTAIHRHTDDSLTVIVLGNLAQLDPGDLARRIAGSYVPPLGTADQSPPTLPSPPGLAEAVQTALAAARPGPRTPTGLTDAFLRVQSNDALTEIRRLGTGPAFVALGCDPLPQAIARHGIEAERLCHFRTTQRGHAVNVAVWLDEASAVIDVETGRRDE